MNNERESQLPRIYGAWNPRTEIIVGLIITAVAMERANEAFMQGFNNAGWFLLITSGVGIANIIQGTRRLLKERTSQFVS